MFEALLINAGVDLAMMVVLCWVEVRIGDVSFIDAVCGAGMAVLALVSFVQVAEPGPRAALLLAMTALWGLRLGIHLFLRWRGHGEDPRYARMLGKARAEGRYGSAAFKLVFGPQAVLLFITSLPAQVGILASGQPAPIAPLAWAGFALWLTGMVFETVGDAQLKAFRADAEMKGKVLDTGLWHYTRHPNYFGDACVWWGLWMVAAETTPGLFSIIGPAYLVFTLTRWSGAPTVEGRLRRRKPGHGQADSAGFGGQGMKPEVRRI